MPDEDPPEGSPEDSGILEPDTSPAFQCPDCLKIFTRKSSLNRHMNSACTEILKPEIFTSPRIILPCVSKLTVNPELETLLSTVQSDYARWRLSQVLGVPQSTSFPVLFSYRFNNSRSSVLSSICPTSDPYTTLYNILIDAKQNYEVYEISIDKNLVVVHSDGSEQNVSKWLKPTRLNPRSNRPIFKVEETASSLIYRLSEPGIDPDLEDSILEDSLQKLSLVDDQLEVNTSLNIENFSPM